MSLDIPHFKKHINLDSREVLIHWSRSYVPLPWTYFPYLLQNQIATLHGSCTYRWSLRLFTLGLIILFHLCNLLLILITLTIIIFGKSKFSMHFTTNTKLQYFNDAQPLYIISLNVNNHLNYHCIHWSEVLISLLHLIQARSKHLISDGIYDYVHLDVLYFFFFFFS